MSTFSISALNSYACRAEITQADIDFVFGAPLRTVAPKFSDPAPASAKPYARRLADKLFRGYAGTAVEAKDNTDDTGRTIAINVKQYGVKAFTHVVRYNANGVMMLWVTSGPTITIIATYTDGVLECCNMYTEDQQMIRNYVGGKINMNYHMWQAAHGLVLGVRRNAVTGEEHNVATTAIGVRSDFWLLDA